MRQDIEMALLSIWIYDEKNEIARATDLIPEMFSGSNKKYYLAIKDYKESGKPYDILLMNECLGKELTNKILLMIGTIGNIYSYSHYLKELKRIYTIENIHNMAETGEMTTEFLKEQIVMLQEDIDEKPIFDMRKDYLKYLADVDRRIKGDYEHYNTGVESLDKLLGNLLPGYFLIISGLHGTGKTNLCVKMMDNIVSKEMPCLYISSEMSPMSLIDKMVSQKIPGLPTQDLKDGNVKGREKEIKDAVMKIYKYPILIHETGDFNIDKLKKRIDEVNPKVLIIDYIQMFYLEVSRGDNRASAMSEIARQLKALAIDKNIVVIALSQVNSDGDVKDSRGPSEKADVVMRVEVMKIEDEQHSQLIKLQITKNRYGVTNRLYFVFSKVNCDFVIDPRSNKEIEELIKQSKKEEQQTKSNWKEKLVWQNNY